MSPTAIRFFGVLSFCILLIVCLVKVVPRIEGQMHSGLIAVAESSAVAVDTILIDGLQVQFAGTAKSDSDSMRIIAAFADVAGIRNLQYHIRVEPDTSLQVQEAIVEENIAEIMQGKVVEFGSGNATLLAASHILLDEIAALLLRNPDVFIRIEGHTDITGSTVVNQQLSQARARAVREYLIEQGVAGDRLHFEGLGSARPIATNATAEGRRANRRVEFHIAEEPAL